MRGVGVPVPSLKGRVVDAFVVVAGLFILAQLVVVGVVPWWGFALVAGGLLVGGVGGRVLAFRRYSPVNRSAVAFVKGCGSRSLSAVLANSALAWDEAPKVEGGRPVRFIPKIARPVEVARGVEVAVKAVPGVAEDVYRKLAEQMKPSVPLGVRSVEALGAADGWFSYLLVTSDPLAVVEGSEFAL